MSDCSVRLGDLVTLCRGASYKSARLDEPGPVLLGLGTIGRNGGFKGDGLRTYGGETPTRILLAPGDLYVSLKDMTHKAELLGAVARVPDAVEHARLTQDTIRLDVHGEVDRTYLYWSLQTPEYRSYCRACGTGTTNLDLSPSDFLAFEIWMPRLDEQRAIAEVLGALDDKIAANRNVIRLADELAETTFRVAAREGEAVPLSSLARFVNGKAFTKGATGTGRVVIRIAELNSGLGGSTVRNDIDVADDHVARPGDLLFAWSGSLTVARWFRDEAIVNQHIFKVIPDGRPLWLVNQAVRSKLRDYQGIAADKATTMGHIQRRHLDETVMIPTPEATACLEEKMSALWRRALSAEVENEQLAIARDGLLPLLMSGKLRVKDAEKHIGEVV